MRGEARLYERLLPVLHIKLLSTEPESRIELDTRYLAGDNDCVRSECWPRPTEGRRPVRDYVASWGPGVW